MIFTETPINNHLLKEKETIIITILTATMAIKDLMIANNGKEAVMYQEEVEEIKITQEDEAFSLI